MRTADGPEFTSQAFIAWAQSHGARPILIQPEQSVHNGYIESFTGKFRDECLHEHWLEERSAIASWRKDYNQAQPDSSLGRISP